MRWTDEEKNRLQKLLKGAKGVSVRGISDEIRQDMGKSASAIRRMIQRSDEMKVLVLKTIIQNKAVKGILSAPNSEEEPELLDYEKVVEAMMDEATKDKYVIHAPEPQEVFKGPLTETGILVLSDVHVGKVNYFLDMETGAAYETYNEEIMFQEMNRLLDSICTVNALLGSGYNIPKLHLFGCGDLIDNEIIVRGQQLFVEYGVGMQLMRATKMFADMLIELLKSYEEVEFTIVPGNHGRLTPRKSKSPTYNNWDHLMGYMLKIWFRDEPRVTICLPENKFCLKDIYGWKYYIHHGDSVYSWMGLPYYGLKKQGVSRRTEVPMDREIIGHFHTRFEIPINSYSKTFVNGCWIDKDDWSWEKYGVLSVPEQYYFGVSPKRPETWSWKLELANPDVQENIQKQWQTWNRINGRKIS